MTKRITVKPTDIPFEWNMYNEGFRQFGVQDKRFKHFPGLRISRTNHAIWRINKSLDMLLVQKVHYSSLY